MSQENVSFGWDSSNATLVRGSLCPDAKSQALTEGQQQLKVHLAAKDSRANIL
jgi:hypothetical protein